LTGKRKDKDHPWDDNMERNKQYIKEFFKKTEREIKEQSGESKVKGE